MSHAVVLGGGMAGMLAASALTGHADRITIVESDRLPDSPKPRKGLPQGYHSHMFMGGGARALDTLLPGTTDLLYAAGAQRRGMSSGMLTRTADGWSRRHGGDAYVIAATRALTDHVIRAQVLREPTITITEGTQVVGLLGDAARIRGVRVQRGTEPEEELSADFVVDATGRRSKTPDWLNALGVAAVAEEVLDSGVAYASRLYSAPPDIHPDFPAVLVQPEAGTGSPGRGGTMFLVEGGRWMVTMIGTRGGQPPTSEAGFADFPNRMRHPLMGELIRSAEPIGEIRAYRATTNRRRFYEQLALPECFAVLGDAATALNPIYAHGMSVAARSAVELRTELERGGLRPGVGAAFQKRVASVVEVPWSMANGQDRNFPDARATHAPPRQSRSAKWFNRRMGRTAINDPIVANALFDIYTLSAEPGEALTRSRILRILRGPRRIPALTAAEAVAQYPELRELLATAPDGSIAAR